MKLVSLVTNYLDQVTPFLGTVNWSVSELGIVPNLVNIEATDGLNGNSIEINEPELDNLSS